MDCIIGVYSTRLLCRSSSFDLDDESPLPLSGVISARFHPMFSHLEDRKGQNHDCRRFLPDCAFFPPSAPSDHPMRQRTTNYEKTICRFPTETEMERRLAPGDNNHMILVLCTLVRNPGSYGLPSYSKWDLADASKFVRVERKQFRCQEGNNTWNNLLMNFLQMSRISRLSSTTITPTTTKIMSIESVELAELDKRELPSLSLRATAPNKPGNSSMCFVKPIKLSIPD